MNAPTSPSGNAPAIDRVFLRRLHLMDNLEAISTLLLFFVAMPLKYYADMPMAVRVVGMVHGVLFIALVMMFLVAIRRVPLAPWVAALGIFASVIPFGPFVMNRVLDRVVR